MNNYDHNVQQFKQKLQNTQNSLIKFKAINP